VTVRAAVTLVRVSAPRAGAVTYLAVPARYTLQLLAGGAAVFAEVAPEHDLDPADVDLDTCPWDALPGARALAARALDGGARVYTILGTVVDGQWTSWYLPVPAPPPPAVR
jgi:hypothetical protein